MSRLSIGIVIGLIGGVMFADEMSFPELLDAGIEGSPKLAAPFLVTTTNGSPVLTEKHGLIAPALWDWDGDGLQDLLLGEFETNSGEKFPMGEKGSSIRVYRNVGTAEEPKFDPEFQWARDTEGTVIEVPQWCCIGFTPYFYDLDDDGYQDMITGQYHPGEVSWFRGSKKGFLPGQKIQQIGNPASNWVSLGGGETRPAIETFEYWVYSSASMGDFDNDGDFDLIVGGSALRISENIGGRQQPSFAQRELLLDIHENPLTVRELTAEELNLFGPNPPISGDTKTSPYVVDWDADGVLDLLVTDSYRSSGGNAISYFRGVKTADGQRFEPGIDLLRSVDGSKALPGSGQRVFVGDWNSDGVQDLLIGASVATVNGGDFSDELSWEWEEVNQIESAGKDPGRYPPQPEPTRETFLAQFEDGEVPYSDEEIEYQVDEQYHYWYQSVGKLLKENKEHWLTIRHQGRLYVMLGSNRNIDINSATTNQPVQDDQISQAREN